MSVPHEKPSSEAPLQATNEDHEKEFHSSSIQLSHDSIHDMQLDNNEGFYQCTEDGSTDYLKTSQSKSPRELTLVMQDSLSSIELQKLNRPLSLIRERASSELHSFDDKTIMDIDIDPISESASTLDSQGSRNFLGQSMTATHVEHSSPEFLHLPSINSQSITQWSSQYPLYDQYPKIVQSYTPYSGISQNTHYKRHSIPFHQPSSISSQQLGHPSESQATLDPFGYGRNQPMSNQTTRTTGSSNAILFHSTPSISDHNIFSSYSTIPIYRGNRSNEGISWSPGVIAPVERLPSPPTFGCAPTGFQGNSDTTIQKQSQQNVLKDHSGHSLSKHQLIAMDPDPKFCNNCRTTQTPSWRRCRQGRILLCNACGLYEKLHGKSRPFFKARDGTIKIHRTLPGHQPCEICGATRTSIWAKSSNDETICFSCNLIAKQHLSKTRLKHEGTTSTTTGDDIRQKTRGITKKKSAVSKVSYFPSSDGLVITPSYIKDSSKPRSKMQAQREPENYPPVGWHGHQLHNQQQLRPPSFYRTNSSVDDQTGGKFSNETSGSYYWDYRYLNYHGQDYFPQSYDRHESKLTNVYNAGLDQEACSSSSMYTEANASNISSAGITSQLELTAMPSFTPSSLFECKDTGVKSEDDYIVGSSDIGAPSSSEPSNIAIQQNLYSEQSSFDYESRDREVKQEIDLVSTPSSMESELTPVEDFESD